MKTTRTQAVLFGAIVALILIGALIIESCPTAATVSVGIAALLAMTSGRTNTEAANGQRR